MGYICGFKSFQEKNPNFYPAGPFSFVVDKMFIEVA